MGAPVTNIQFAANIRKSLPPSYRPLLTSMSAAVRLAKTPFSSEMLIQTVLEEADHQAVARNAEKAAENAAMIAAASRKPTKDRGHKQKKTGNGLHCTNCEWSGHIDIDCYQKGGRKEGQQPWKKKKDSTAAAVLKDNDEDLALITIPSLDSEDENVALMITSDF